MTRAHITIRLARVALLCSLAGPATALPQQDQDLARRVLELETLLEDHLTGEDEHELGLSASYADVRATFQLFADVGLSVRDPEPVSGGHSDFVFGTLDFVLNAGLGDHFRVFSETVIHGDSDDEIGFSQERLWLSWIASDALYVKFGTEHSALLRWNQLYHHGAWLQPTIERPVVARFEGGGGILPLHRTGVTVGGSKTADSGRVEYFGTLSNGRGETPGDKQRTDDADDHKAVDLGLAVIPAAVPDLRVGLVLIKDEIPEDPGSADPLRMSEMDETIAAANVELKAGRTHITGEVAFIRHEAEATGQEFDSNAGYLQLVHRGDRWTPYARFDYRNMHLGDPFYAPDDRDLDQWIQSVGLRWDVHPHVAIKFELGAGRADQRGPGGIAEEDVYMGLVQLSWWL